MIIPSEPVKAWCQSCRSQVTLMNVRPWPEGVLVVGQCPRCQASLASRKPVGWTDKSAYSATQHEVTEPQQA